MLKFKFNVNNYKNDYKEIELSEVFIASDGSFISGITNIDESIIDGQKIYLSLNESDDLTEYNVEVKNVTRYGEVKTFTYTDDSGNTITGNCKTYYPIHEKEVESNVFVSGVTYKDGCFYELCYSGDTHFINVSGQSMFFGDSGLTEDVTYYIEKNKIMIGDFEYDIDHELGDSDIVEYNGLNTNPKIYKAEIYDASATTKVSKLYIRKNDDIKLDVDSIFYGKNFYYFTEKQKCEIGLGVNGETIYGIKDEVKDLTSEIPLSGDGDTYKALSSYTTNLLNGEICYFVENDNITSAYTSAETIVYNDVVYPLEKSWGNTLQPTDHLNVFFSASDEFSIEKGDVIELVKKDGLNQCFLETINVERTKPSMLTFDYSSETISAITKENIYATDSSGSTEIYVFVNGEKIILTDNDLVDFIRYETSGYTKEYEIIKIRRNDELSYEGYYDADDTFIRVKVYDDVSSGFTFLNNLSSDITSGDKKIVKKYSFTYGGEKYFINDLSASASTDVNIGDFYTTINEKKKYSFIVEDVIGPNALVCRKNSQWESLDASFLNNLRYYDVIYKKSIFNKDFTVVRCYDQLKNYIEKIKLYNNSSFLTLPLKLENYSANNMLQETIIKRDFVDYEVNSQINRIVDMEKDMYYPALEIGSVTMLLNELIFKLHFRTRNMDNWNINDVEEPNNWNIIDYYYDDYNNIVESEKNLFDKSKNTSITKYSQPADLLYFLGFDGDDVFYQKSKLKKSFLRLLFYDSTNPKTQNLLAMSTIFIDADKLYKKYIDNSDVVVGDEFLFVDITNGNVSEYIDVDKEPFTMFEESDGFFSYDDNSRLDATFSVKNMYEEEKSSEGFYLFLFKEFSSNLHEKNVYLKIQFNNAGTGKISNFLIPTSDMDENGDYDIFDLTQEGDRELFKDGYPLNEICDRLYIKLKVKYDINTKRYVYYLPKYMYNPNDSNKVVFNLYELKIKDES